MARAIVVLSFDVETGDEMGPIMKAIDPQRLPYFAGEARVAVEPVSRYVTDWLDHDSDPETSGVQANGGDRG